MAVFFKINSRKFCTNAKQARPTRNSHIMKYMQSKSSLKEMVPFIPEKYFTIKRKTPPENLYLIDEDVAKSVVNRILPLLKRNEDQVICETNAGLGLISSQLLDNGIKLVRLYESCSEFRQSLKDFNNVYPDRVELFSKDIFQLYRMSYLDKIDRGNRIDQMFKGVKKKNWNEDVTMSIIGAMPRSIFFNYLTKMLALQAEVIRYGRIQLFVFIKPQDYITLTAGPHLNLHTYQKRSVLFNLFYNYTLLEKYPRKSFLPWESTKQITNYTRYARRIDSEYLYLVQVNFKKNLPIETNFLLPLYYFVQQFFGRGTNRVIPTVEKWIPDSGTKLIVPTRQSKFYFKDMNIFTKFGQLTPTELLLVFVELINNPCYQNSPFVSMVEAELLKSETIASDVNEIDTAPKNDVFQETFVK